MNIAHVCQICKRNLHGKSKNMRHYRLLYNYSMKNGFYYKELLWISALDDIVSLIQQLPEERRVIGQRTDADAAEATFFRQLEF